ncbi:hypothetical protein U9M48_022607 [Paspalum notatum var. saurae]|uniref:Gnk2-homologous domain-containing protein n=1 Tax=Paspalum notatum var. saurae TaxID=547442 RepID=A0AAQ3WTS5_PASNO
MHLVICCLAAVLLRVDAAAPGTFIHAGCSPSRYAPNTAFETNLNSLLASMASTASSGATYSTFTSASARGAAPEAAPAAYGLYQCRGDLRAGECAACVRDTVARAGAACAGARAATVQSDGCYVRYGASAADASAAYHRCGASTSADAGFLRARAAVLADLQQGADASGGFKASSSGPVQGAAQCLGVVAAADCAACLSLAVEQLGRACGDALAADVYMGQCSVRYWTNGNYFRSPQDNSDDVGRTLAIAIGIMAGVALFVVFVSLLRKSC